MSEKHPEYIWIRVNVLNPPFYCPKHKMKLKMYSFQLTGASNESNEPQMLDTWICPEKDCPNKIMVESFYKRAPRKAKLTKNKGQKRLIP